MPFEVVDSVFEALNLSVPVCLGRGGAEGRGGVEGRQRRGAEGRGGRGQTEVA